jgi:hypothetical protein
VARATPDVSHGDSVARVDEVADRYPGVGIPGVAELLVKTHDGLAPYVGPRLRPILHGPHDDVGIVKLTKCVHVPRVPRLEESTHDFHVLLRNTPSPALRMGDFMCRV